MTQILHPLLFQVWPNHLPILSTKTGSDFRRSQRRIFPSPWFPKTASPPSKTVFEKKEPWRFHMSEGSVRDRWSWCTGGPATFNWSNLLGQLILVDLTHVKLIKLLNTIRENLQKSHNPCHTAKAASLFWPIYRNIFWNVSPYQRSPSQQLPHFDIQRLVQKVAIIQLCQKLVDNQNPKIFTIKGKSLDFGLRLPNKIPIVQRTTTYQTFGLEPLEVQEFEATRRLGKTPGCLLLVLSPGQWVSHAPRSESVVLSPHGWSLEGVVLPREDGWRSVLKMQLRSLKKTEKSGMLARGNCFWKMLDLFSNVLFIFKWCPSLLEHAGDCPPSLWKHSYFKGTFLFEHSRWGNEEVRWMIWVILNLNKHHYTTARD